MTTSNNSHSLSWRQTVAAYLELCKPKVVALMIITSIVGMLLAVPGMVPWRILLFGNLGIALAASAAAVINHLADYRIDSLMQRTQHRPIVKGKVSIRHSLWFAMILAILALIILLTYTNILVTILTFVSLIVYAGVYTYYLKHATSQNIVIGGIAGAAPPLLGWTAVSGNITFGGLVLLLIIFVWTPPHFWALAIYRVEEYAKAKVPMLPITHGIPYTKLTILLYTLLLSATTLLPTIIGISGWLYLICAILLDARFLYWAVRLYRTNEKSVAFKTFKFSILYLLLLFCALLVDHYTPALPL